jgi:5'-nucleotidase
MAFDLSKTLVVGISATALFDLSEADSVFRAHVFFDDQDAHLATTAKHVPSGKVPYKSGSLLLR